MESDSGTIRITYYDSAIDGILSAAADSNFESFHTRHFNQNEEFFLNLESAFTVPHLPIHHDINSSVPEPQYLSGIKDVLTQITALVPFLFTDIRYFFNPADILKPCFYKLYKIQDSMYIYLLKIDLMYRMQDCTVIEKGDNDITPCFSTKHLFLEGLFIPLEDVAETEDNTQLFQIRQTISDTWIGETDRGYFAQGIWIDDDLSKFFTKLFIPKKKRIYPYYPFVCRYKTVCYFLVNLSPVDRKKYLPYLHKALDFLTPHIETVQKEIKDSSFSEELVIFKKLKGKIPPEWEMRYQNIQVERYLNENDMREFKIEA